VQVQQGRRQKNALSWYTSDGVRHKIEKMRDLLGPVFAGAGGATTASNVLTASGIVSAKQVTLLVVAHRVPTANLAVEGAPWLRDAANGVRFNVGVVTRDALLARYGVVLRHAVAFNI